MPSMQDRPRSLFGPKSHAGLGLFAPLSKTSATEELPTTPLPATNSPLEQKDTAILPAQLTPVPPMLTRQLSNPGITRQLSNPGVTRQLSSSGITRQLSSSGIIGDEAEGTAARGPVLIKREMNKRVSAPLTPRSHRKRRLLVTMSGVLILTLFTAFALMAASPLGHNVGLNFNLSVGANSQVFSSNSSNLSLVAQATATAVYNQQNDGYGGGAAQLNGDGSGSLNWPFGQCTYWANYRYHQLTGFWVSWIGDADQWAIGAKAAGWNVSTSPHVPSIIVLMPYIQGAYGVGHVAVVESVNDSVTPEIVHTSNMNWYANGGSWGHVSYADFTVGTGGVYFIWHK